MPRLARGLADGHCCHVLNRGNGRQNVFHKDGDFQAFLNLLVEAKERYSIKIYAWCLMTNHFHLLLCPENGDDLSRAMQWLMTSHVRRYHRHHNSSGHIWQGRYKSFLVQDDEHLQAVTRYVERNPVTAGMVSRAIEWAWSSHAERLGETDKRIVSELPLPFAGNWEEFVNAEMSEKEQQTFAESITRQAPFGSMEWRQKMCEKFGLESTIRAKGRPKKMKK